MIPLRDDAPRLRGPVLTWLLILALAAGFAWQLSLEFTGQARELEQLLGVLGLEVDEFLAAWRGRGGKREFSTLLRDGVLPVVGHALLHAGPLHALASLLFCWVFADNVEGRLGRGRFALFVLLAIVATALAECLIDPDSQRLVVGASAAISAILGAYLVLFAKARVLFFCFALFELPAWFVLLAWFVLQLPDVQGCLGWLHVTGPSLLTHAIGFGVGLVLLPFFLIKNPKPQS